MTYWMNAYMIAPDSTSIPRNNPLVLPTFPLESDRGHLEIAPHITRPIRRNSVSCQD